MDSLLSPDRLITHPGLARLLCLPVSYTHSALCTRISRWLLSSHIRSIILPSKNHLYLVSLFTGCLAFPRSQLCHSDQSSVNGKQPLYTRAEHTTAALSRNSCILFNILWASTCCWTGPPWSYSNIFRCILSSVIHSSTQQSRAQDMKYAQWKTALNVQLYVFMIVQIFSLNL